MRILLFALVLVVIGCGPTPKPAPPATKSALPIKSVKTSKPEVTVKDEDGTSSYVVRAKESDIQVDEKGLDYGVMSSVTGEVKDQKQEIKSRFEATSGSIDRDKRILLLAGRVKITGMVKRQQGDGPNNTTSVPVVMVADEVRYDQNKERYEAKGSVTVTSDGLTIGPMPAVWADKELKKIATPNKYK